MEIHFDPRTRMVTLELSVQDAHGYFIPNIRRENFAVYENGIRQHSVTVEVEHAAVTFGLLIESGGHYPGLNEALEQAASSAAHQFLDEIGRDDRVAIWTYADNLQPLCEFSQDSAVLQHALNSLHAAPVSEANLYDALIAALGQMRAQSGRKALILISSGVDTFSKATFEDALQAARTSMVPIYAINDGVAARSGILPSGATHSRIDWQRAEAGLRKIAIASGGRLYSPELIFEIGATRQYVETGEVVVELGAGQGAAGIDGESIEMFEANLSRNLYKLWNRMASGSYFPPPVKQVEIAKKSGNGKRVLGIPTVADRIAQQVAKARIVNSCRAIWISAIMDS